MEIKKIPNVEIITGSKSKVDYFEVYNNDSYSMEEAMLKIKDFYKTTLENDTIQKYEEYRYCFYTHTSNTKYSSFIGNNTSNFEEGGIRDWDNPFFYNMDEYLFAMIYHDSQSTNYVIYKNNIIVLDETENNKK
ncbi:hypothetical protein LNQ49_01310 [Flavobacterium sp. F-65]|jgi:hypothetical protein|uniref:Immunity protein 22 n=1 Tax=Flavobacterium pisciphilum TaxID=2893755 RepID=A0ABS8MNA8_9FLAO|nr:hypothetical protein [Flavobacterium sp. F-65]MCC9070242.1 hypothetical protein [Flavobacterium sp. F-65]